MKHKHHLTPRYRGGSDDSSNIVELTVVQHAMFHYCNWRLWGRSEDKIAWKALSGQISFDEAKRQSQVLGGRKGADKFRELMLDEDYRELFKSKIKTKMNDPSRKAKVIETALKSQPLATQAALSEEAKLKRLNTLKSIKHQQGERNSQYGTMWITDGAKNKKVKKEDPVPEGYWRGRTL
jgi:hypothetical protein